MAAGNLDVEDRIDILIGLGSGTPALEKAYEDASNTSTTATLHKQGGRVCRGVSSIRQRDSLPSP